MFAQNSSIIAALDIGTSKTVVLVAEKGIGGISIIGIGQSKSIGVSNGVIKDQKALRSLISSAVYEAEKMARRNIDRVAVSFSNPLMCSNSMTIRTNFGGGQILPSDIKRIKRIVFDRIDMSKNEVLSYNVISHDLDGIKNVQDPEFMFANLLTSYIHIVTIPVQYLVDIGTCLLRCQLKINQFILSSEASGNSCLTIEEAESGCVLIDMGSGCSDYAVYKGKKIIFCGAVPFGGNAITKDIASYFALSFDEAEELKIAYGEVKTPHRTEKRFVEIKRENSADIKQIDLELLSRVITARVSEILELIMQKIKEKRQNRSCFNKIVITGGSSQIKAIIPFVESKYGLGARVGAPNNSILYKNLYENPAFSTVLGLIHGSQFENNVSFFRRGITNLKHILSWLKESL